MSEIRNLQPEKVWTIFDEITKVPRPSKKEEKIREFLLNFAKEHNFECKTDAIGNVVMECAATPGKENAPKVILQAHMDMVCEKNAGVQHDFLKDAIQPRIVDGWVKAEGTTLGADDGIGIAAALAVLTDKELVHGPVQALFTVDEETGLTGAFNIGENMLSGKYLINLDSEDEGEMFIGCAGGVDTVATLRYTPEAAPQDYKYFKVAVSGLTGGHSGDDINKMRANSNKLAARFLMKAREFGIVLSSFSGGNLHNAIPRESYAVLGVRAESAAQLKAMSEKFAEDIKAEFAITEPTLKFEMEEADAPATVIDCESARKLILLLVGVEHGVIENSAAMPGLVETSTNLAAVKTFEGRVEIITSQRSSVESAKEYARQKVSAVFELAGCEVKSGDGYPGWAPDPSSKLLEITVESYESLFGYMPIVRAIHAGLECGLFLEKYPHLEMVSFGPTLRGVHSPDERIEIVTVDKFWKHLVDLLERLANL